jgi:hypothetical protein
MSISWATGFALDMTVNAKEKNRWRHHIGVIISRKSEDDNAMAKKKTRGQTMILNVNTTTQKLKFEQHEPH